MSGYDESQMVSRHVSQFPYRPRCLFLHCLLQPKGVHIVAGTFRTPSSLFLSLSALNPFKKESDIFSRPELCLLLFLLSCKRKKKDTDSHQHLPVITICSFLFTQRTPSPSFTANPTIFPNLHIHSQSLNYFCLLKQSNILTNLIRPRAKLGSLSIAQMQMVEIAKAVSANCKVLILDEPLPH